MKQQLRGFLSATFKFALHLAKGIGIVLLGFLVYIWQRLTNNPYPDVVAFWQALGSGIVLIGLLEMVNTGPLFKSDEQVRHEEVVKKLAALELQLADLNQRLAVPANSQVHLEDGNLTPLEKTTANQ